MLKRTKKITLIFIWLTGLMFFAHGITPHHHHFDSVLEHQDTAVPDNHHEDNPVHCHAFNDLVIDKSEVTSVNNQIPESFTATVFGNNLNRLITENSGKKTDTALQDKIPPEAVLLKNTPTRGSPTPA